MSDVRVILDFPGPDGNGVRHDFGTPRRVIQATELERVRPALREAERCAAEGAYVAGFLAYEAAPAFDGAMVARRHAGPAPLLWFAVCDAPRPAAAPAAAPPLPAYAWRPDTAREEYDGAIRTIRSAIAAGAVYQVNHTLRFHADCDTDPLTWYNALVAQRHGRYHALLQTHEWAIISASPELFLDIARPHVTTRPMKGTIRRGRWLEEDRRAEQQLARSSKDRAENLMIVDLLRNDLGRIAEFGSVHVASMFDLETYPTVHQLTSTIRCTLRDHASLEEILAATFPCGSVTGAPKIAAMQAIARLEHAPRGPYCGAIGVLRPDGNATFNVAIRTLLVDRAARAAVYGAGGGITWDSSAGAEYEEALAKASLLHETTPTFDLLETMRLEHGSIPRLDLHLARLGESAAYWSFDPRTPRNARDALRAEAAAAPTGAWRLRLTAARTGHIVITRTPLAEPEGLPGFHATGSHPPADAHSPGRNVAPGVGTVALALRPIDSNDRLLCHKTTARAVYDARRADHPHVFDVLLWNERGEVTEFTNGNLVVEIDDVLVTPARAAGLLDGTCRAQLLRAGTIHEAVISLADLQRATRFWFINSVRGCVPVTPTLPHAALPAGPDAGVSRGRRKSDSPVPDASR